MLSYALPRPVFSPPPAHRNWWFPCREFLFLGSSFDPMGSRWRRNKSESAFPLRWANWLGLGLRFSSWCDGTLKSHLKLGCWQVVVVSFWELQSEFWTTQLLTISAFPTRFFLVLLHPSLIVLHALLHPLPEFQTQPRLLVCSFLQKDFSTLCYDLIPNHWSMEFSYVSC